MGGHDGMSIFNSVERFNPESAKWEHVKPMRSRRCRLGACALNGKLYVCGGLVWQSHTQRSFRARAYTTLLLGWCRWYWLPPFTNTKKNNSTQDGLTSRRPIYMFSYDGSQFLRSVEMYDPSRDEWTELSSMNVKRSRVSLIANCGRLFAIGGYDGVSNLSSMEVRWLIERVKCV